MSNLSKKSSLDFALVLAKDVLPKLAATAATAASIE